jgi:predicted kinase
LASLLVVFAGLPGVGKSTLARAVAQRLNAIWLRVDLVEASLLKAGLTRSFETGLGAYIAACDIAADHLRLGRAAVADAVNGIEPGRAMWRVVARECKSDLFFVEVVCSNREEHRRRVESRDASTPPLPLPSWNEVLQREYEPWTDPVLTIDAVAPVDHCVDEILSYLVPTARRATSRFGLGEPPPES